MPRRSSYTPAPSTIDEKWPHQIALPDDLCCRENYGIITEFCAAHGLAPQHRRVQAIWPDRKYDDYRLYCFAAREEAELFQTHFGGEWFDPKKDRERGLLRGPWRKQGVWIRLLESGPLKMPVSLRD